MTVPDHFGLSRTDTVTISRETARLIDRAFLPLNPNKLRGRPKAALEALRAACFEFKAALAKAESAP